MKHDTNKLMSFSLKLVKEKHIRFSSACINNKQVAAKALSAYIGNKDCEHLAVLMVDSQNNLIGLATVAIGGIVGLQCSMRDIFKTAIISNAKGIILGHNHPSGNVNPSKEDIAFTESVKSGGKFLGIDLIDHVIVSVNGDIYSFLDNGLI